MKNDKKLKIIYFYQYFGTPKGGWSTRVYELCKRWVAEGHQVTVVTTPYDKSDIPKFKGLYKVFDFEGIRVIVLNFPQSNKLTVLRRIIQFVKFISLGIFQVFKQQYDVAIASSGPITVGILGLAAKIFRRKKFVFEVRDLWPSGAVQLGIIKSRMIIKAAYWFEERCYRHADLIVACSIGMKLDIEKRFHYQHIIVAPNASDNDLFGTANNQVLPVEYHDKDIIVYAGSLGRIDHCIEIMHACKEIDIARFPNLRVVIIGDGIDRKVMEEYKKENDLWFVEFLGLIPKVDVALWLQNAKATLFTILDIPMLHTASPNKIFDSFAAGKPIIQTTTGWIRDLVNDHSCGLNVEPNDAIAMARAIERYLADEELLAFHSSRAKELAKTIFNRDYVAISMINAITALFQPSKSRKHIWVINQFAGHEQSGWGERHYFMSKYWQDQGYRVSIISGSFNHMFNNLPNAPEAYNFEKLPFANFIWIRTPSYNPKSVMRFWSMLVFAWKSFSLPAKRIGYPSAIIVSSMPIFPIVSGKRLKKKYNADKLIFEIRDIWPLTLNELGEVSKWHPISLFIGWFEKFGYRHADKIVSLLPFAADHIVKNGGTIEKISYIPNGLEADILEQEKISAEIKDSIPNDKFIIGYTGTHSLANALEYLVEAASLLEHKGQYFFILVGEGYKKPYLLQQAAALGNIKFFPKLPKSQMQDLITNFDVCFVGRQDSALFDYGVSGNKYFDYMLAAKPILDANNSFGSPAELAGASIRVKAESAQAIVQGIELLYNMNSAERQRMGNAGNSYAKSHHSTSILASSYISIFEETQNSVA